jgi:hypothetical protein
VKSPFPPCRNLWEIVLAIKPSGIRNRTASTRNTATDHPARNPSPPIKIQTALFRASCSGGSASPGVNPPAAPSLVVVIGAASPAGVASGIKASVSGSIEPPSTDTQTANVELYWWKDTLREYSLPGSKEQNIASSLPLGLDTISQALDA